MSSIPISPTALDCQQQTGIFSAFFWLGLSVLLSRIVFFVAPLVKKENPTFRKSKAPQKPSRSNRQTSNEPSSFPWKHNDGSRSHTNISKEASKMNLKHAVNYCLPSFLDRETRRTKKWDQERRKCREVQQMLATLRVLRAQRALAKSHSLSFAGDTPQSSSDKRRVQISLPEREGSAPNASEFPWNSDDKASNLLGDSKQPSAVSQLIGSIMSIFVGYTERKRKQRWDSEVKRYRPLQQQLLTLQAVRAKRSTSGCMNVSFCSSVEIHPVGPNKFPWRDVGGR